jgi:Cu/Ag efflux pump CusA
MPGLGAEIYRGLAAVVAGGMVVGTAFTWVLMPSLLRLGEDRIVTTDGPVGLAAVEEIA